MNKQIETSNNLPQIDVERTGKRIKELMRKNHISVRELQTYLNLGSEQAIYGWLRGCNMPSIDNLYILSELFNVPIDEIVCGTKIHKVDSTRYTIMMEVNQEVELQKHERKGRFWTYFYKINSFARMKEIYKQIKTKV